METDQHTLFWCFDLFSCDYPVNLVGGNLYYALGLLVCYNMAVLRKKRKHQMANIHKVMAWLVDMTESNTHWFILPCQCYERKTRETSLNMTTDAAASTLLIAAGSRVCKTTIIYKTKKQ